MIQDASTDPQCQGHPAIRMRLTRYLAVPVFTTGGEVLGTLCFLDDRSHLPLGREDVEFLSVLAMRVSAELERERAIEARLAEERAASGRLKEMNDRLLRAAEEKRRLTATVIHDLRQPLATLRTSLYLLRDEDDPGEREECLNLLDHRLTALDGLVEELMEYARIEAGRLPWRVEQVHLPELLTRCVEGFSPEAAARGITLSLELDPLLGACETDGAKLCHIVRNLVSNAIKFTSGHAPATVTVRAAPQEPASWRLEVEDTGPGIPQADAPHIFDEFYQGANAEEEEARSRYPHGRGLGLAIVKHLCTAMGVEIIVHSSPGEGTRFALTFPQTPSPS